MKRAVETRADAEQIAMIGCGSMGGSMALLFAEVGISVGLSDPNEEAMDGVVKKAEESEYHGRVKKYKGILEIVPYSF